MLGKERLWMSHGAPHSELASTRVRMIVIMPSTYNIFAES
jgi:hypothetical protein